MYDACAKYIGALRQTINDKPAPEIDLNIRPVLVKSHTVIIIEVAEAEIKNYHLASNTFYVRRGPNNRQPNLDELKQMMHTWGGKSPFGAFRE